MPVMDGFAATAAWRERERAGGGGRVPIIALTADVIKGVQERCRAAGMDDYLSKPFEQAQLVAALDRWLPAVEVIAAAPPADIDFPLAPTPELAPPPPPAPLRLPPAPADSPLEERALAQIRALGRPGQPSMLRKIIGLYIESAPAQIERMRDAVAAGDSEALRQAAHTLKSSSANLGATRLADLCKELEQRGRDRRLDGAAALLPDVDRHYARARDALLAEGDKEERLSALGG